MLPGQAGAHHGLGSAVLCRAVRDCDCVTVTVTASGRR